MRVPRWFYLTILFAGCFFACNCRVISQGPDPAISNRVLATTFPTGSTYHNYIFGPLTLYVIDLNVAPGLDSFSATEQVLYTNSSNRTIDEIILQVFPNAKFISENAQPNITIDELKIDGTSAKPALTGTVMKVPLGRTLTRGGEARLTIKFNGRVPKLKLDAGLLGAGLQQLFELIGGGGKASGNFGIYSFSGDMLSLGEWYPIIPRLRENGFDVEEPSGIGDVADFEVANYQVDVTVPASVTVATSGIKVSESRRGETKTLCYQAGAMRDFAVACSPKYEKDSKAVVDPDAPASPATVVNSYFLPQHRQGGEKLLKYAVQALQYYERAFGKYPYPKLDVVEAPLRGGAGGMEYPAMVTISHLFYAPDKMGSGIPGIDELLQGVPGGGGMDAMMGDMLEFIAAHEVAHQWWHALVGNDSKANPFVDEALANYSSILYFEDLHGKAVADKQTYLQMELNYQMHRAMGGRDMPVDEPTSAFKNNFEYAAIVYGKGALYYRALRNKVGKETFLKIMQRYVDRNRFRIATPGDLEQTIDATLASTQSSFTPQQADLLARRWLKETHGDEDIGALQFGKLLDVMMPPEFLNSPEGQQVRSLMDKLGPLLLGAMGGVSGNQAGQMQLPNLDELLKALQGIGNP